MNIPTANDEIPSLTDEDVHLLGSIVFAAEKISGPPFRALFTAYDRVLAERGIPPESDKVYFPTVLELGEGFGDGETLFKRFKRLLEGKGIIVDLDRDEDVDGEIARRGEGGPIAGRRGFEGDEAQAKRRASFDEALDQITEGERQNDVFADVAGSYHEPRRTRSSSQVAHRSAAGSRKAGTYDIHTNRPASIAQRGRVNARRASEQIPARPKRGASLSSVGSLVIRRNYGRASANAKDAYSADESEEAEMDDLNSNLGHENLEHDNEPEALDPITELARIRDASNFRRRETNRLARQCLLQWIDKAQELQTKNQEMERMALEHDRFVLLRSGFGLWLDKCRIRKQEIETRKFFVHMERRADRARNLFLLTKAFTHWAQSASDEIRRTSTARRHILRTRYFNAWKDITVVNALKVRRQGLRKFLGLWRNRTAALVDGQIKALVHYEDNLVERHYWRWFWAFCARRAPLWGDQRLRHGYFSSWLAVTNERREKELAAANFGARSLLKKVVLSWKSEVRSVLESEAAAEDFRGRRLVSNALDRLRKEVRLRRPIAHVRHAVDDRLIKAGFDSWRIRFQQSRQALIWSKRKILQNAVAAWKCRLVGSHMNERLLVQALYKWTLASRSQLMLRIRNANLKRSVLALWAGKADVRANALADAGNSVGSKERVQTLRTFLQHWSRKTAEQQENEQIAIVHHQQRLQTTTFRAWTTKAQHLQMLEQWSNDAQYYVTAKHALSTWHNATLHARKRRRRETYAQVRRNNKMQLARRMLQKWYEAASVVTNADRLANQIREDALTRNANRLLENWHRQTVDIMDMTRQATDLHCHKVLTLSFGRLEARQQELHNLQSIGATFEFEILAGAASTCFKRLNWRLFRIQQQESSASALRRRNFEKNVRGMLRYWLEKSTRGSTSDTYQYRDPQSPQHDRSVEEQEEEGLDEEENQPIPTTENWTALDASALDLNPFNTGLSILQSARPPANPSADVNILTSTPLPGYLRTPSRRAAARGKALERFQTLNPQVQAPVAATPAPQLNILRRGTASAPNVASQGGFEREGAVTPFERKLRAQGFSATTRPTSTPVRGRGARRGRGQIGFRGFSDIPETENAEMEGNS